MKGARMHVPVQIMGQAGSTLPLILFSLFGFSCLVLSVLLWIKQEDNSFEKASKQIGDLRTDVLLEIGKLKTGTESAEKQAKDGWDLLQDHLSKEIDTATAIEHRFDANELEIKRLKEWRDLHVENQRKMMAAAAAVQHHEVIVKQDKPWEFVLRRSAKGAKVGKAAEAKVGRGYQSPGSRATDKSKVPASR